MTEEYDATAAAGLAETRLPGSLLARLPESVAPAALADHAARHHLAAPARRGCPGRLPAASGPRGPASLPGHCPV